MGKSLVIVESPAKAKTINKYLGSEYVVEASIGHIMDLPKNDIGVELEKRTFAPPLIVSRGKEKIVDRLKKLAPKADMVYLAPDPDREGEAIAAHLSMQLLPVMKDKSKIRRVTFNEITQKAVKAAFEHARDVNEDLVDAQQTRRVLDRLVGYQVSPLLWDKVRRGLSAGRVQTVALRLIVEREGEINAFQPVEYWTLDALLDPGKGGQNFTARMVGIEGKPVRVANGLDKEGKEQFLANALPDKEAIDEVLAQLEGAAWSVRGIEKKERRRNPQAPFTTSKLQQDASSRLGFNVRRTMGVAQRLYEGIEIGKEGAVGLITYMRTDSTRISDDAIRDVRDYITERYGSEFVPAGANVYKSKKDAQDAHEAIRPTSMAYSPEVVDKYLAEDEMKLYRLIWNRFVACQMMPALYDQTTIDVSAKGKDGAEYMFRATGSVLKFEGFLKVYQESKDQVDEDDEEMKHRLPLVTEGEHLRFKAIRPEQHFTEPPPRYNEATLVKRLEADGVGRPSTYASIISTILEREYVKKEANRFTPTELGMVVVDLLLESFDDIFEVKYTARMEEELDEIEEGKIDWRQAMGEFY